MKFNSFDWPMSLTESSLSLFFSPAAGFFALLLGLCSAKQLDLQHRTLRGPFNLYENWWNLHTNADKCWHLLITCNILSLFAHSSAKVQRALPWVPLCLSLWACFFVLPPGKAFYCKKFLQEGTFRIKRLWISLPWPLFIGLTCVILPSNGQQHAC